MSLADLKEQISNLDSIKRTANELQIIGSKIKWDGLVGSAKSVCISSVSEQVPGNHLIILEDKEQAAYFLNDIEGLYPDNKNILFYPASYRVPYELEKTDNANVVARAEVLERISKGNNTWIVTYPQALFEKIPSEKNLVKSTLKVEVGKSYSIDFINETLLEVGFDRVDFVYEPGQFSIRGGIIDVFSFANDHPYRIEFFDDEIDSLRSFDVNTQLSISPLETIDLLPNTVSLKCA